MTEVPDITEVRAEGLSTEYVIELSDRTTIEYRPIYDFSMAEQRVYPAGQRFDPHSKREIELRSLAGVETPDAAKLQLTVFNWIEFYSSFYRWDTFKEKGHDGLVQSIVMSQNDIEGDIESTEQAGEV